MIEQTNAATLVAKLEVDLANQALINNVKQGDKVDFTVGRVAIDNLIKELSVPLAWHKEARGGKRATSKPLKEKA
jgi:hypothetical protein